MPRILSLQEWAFVDDDKLAAGTEKRRTVETPFTMETYRLPAAVAAVLIETLLPVRAQTNIFPASGNVGIGTTTPGSVLHARGAEYSPATSGSAQNSDLRIGATTTNLALDFGITSAGTANGWIQARNQANYASNYALLLNPNGGNVGIGTTGPNNLLTIGAFSGMMNYPPSVGAAQVAIGKAGSVYAADNGSVLLLGGGYHSSSTNNATFAAIAGLKENGTDNDASGYLALYVGKDGLSNSAERMRITSTGLVGIGTTNPTHPLTVNGTVRAKEVIVDTGWSDFVFAPSYSLMPLPEVKRHIQVEGHLPGIPSAEEVKTGGISLGEMQARLLQKIEELTLHQIAQEERMQELERKNAELRKHF